MVDQKEATMDHWYIWLPAVTGALRAIDDILALALRRKFRRACACSHAVTKGGDLDQ